MGRLNFAIKNENKCLFFQWGLLHQGLKCYLVAFPLSLQSVHVLDMAPSFRTRSHIARTVLCLLTNFLTLPKVLPLSVVFVFS